MSRLSGRRGQVEPLAAIVAVVAVGAGLTVYAGALDGHLPGTGQQNVAGPALDRLVDTATDSGSVDPRELGAARTDAVPDGYRLNATLTTGEQQWEIGPNAPASAQAATEQVSVRLAPGRVRPGRLTVRVWR